MRESLLSPVLRREEVDQSSGDLIQQRDEVDLLPQKVSVATWSMGGRGWVFFPSLLWLSVFLFATLLRGSPCWVFLSGAVVHPVVVGTRRLVLGREVAERHGLLLEGVQGADDEVDLGGHGVLAKQEVQ
jgi:hypothetical protein